VGHLSRFLAVTVTLLFIAFPQAQAKKRLFSQNEIETQKVDDEDTTIKSDRVGSKAASKYFEKEKSSPAKKNSGGGERDHYLALHLGFFLDSDAYSWGVDNNDRNYEHAEDPGKLTLGVTYRMGEWSDTMDLNLRMDFQTYDLGKDKPFKLSIVPLITFPDANSQFPLYFGAGVGPGIFFKQTSHESALSLDYQLIAGARMFDLIENTGFFLEFGLKNHLLLLSDGQFNGVYIAGGAIFTF
jgi:hypothetical protein